MDLAKIFHEMTLFGWSIVIILILMSIASLGIAVERLIAYSRARKQSIEFARFSGAALRDMQFGKVLAGENEEQYRYAYAARIVCAALTDAEDMIKIRGELSELETVASAMRRAADEELLYLRRGTTVVATVGSSGPFVGLLGTVIGIIAAFQGIAETGSGGLGAVSAGIAEALIATALGLLVAIPATWLYNYFNGRIDGFQVVLDNTMSEMLDHMAKCAPKLSIENFERPAAPKAAGASKD